MLEFGTQSSSKSSSNVIVQKVKVADINVTYGEKREWQKYSDDIGMDITLEIGQSFQPTMYIGGSFKVDDVNGTIVGWGRAYKVKMFFDAIGLPLRLAKNSSIAENRLPNDAAAHINDKEFLRLSYMSTSTKPDGSNRWRDWQDTQAVGSEDKLKAEFNKAVENGYVKDFLQPGAQSANQEDSSWSNKEAELEDLPL